MFKIPACQWCFSTPLVDSYWAPRCWCGCASVCPPSAPVLWLPSAECWLDCQCLKWFSSSITNVCSFFPHSCIRMYITLIFKEQWERLLAFLHPSALSLCFHSNMKFSFEISWTSDLSFSPVLLSLFCVPPSSSHYDIFACDHSVSF